MQRSKKKGELWRNRFERQKEKDLQERRQDSEESYSSHSDGERDDSEPTQSAASCYTQIFDYYNQRRLI